MSWWVELNDDDGNPCKVRPFMGGGIVRANPETMEEVPSVEAELNVTYNYSRTFDLAASAALYELHRKADLSPSPERVMLEAWYEDGFRSLSLKRASECRGGLELMIAQLDPRGLGPIRDDYWAPTPTNAAHALRTILGWCHDAPNGVFDAN